MTDIDIGALLLGTFGIVASAILAWRPEAMLRLAGSGPSAMGAIYRSRLGLIVLRCCGAVGVVLGACLVAAATGL